MPVKPKPARYHTVTPYLVVDRASRVIEFMRQVFGAKEFERIARPDGRVMHAEVEIGDSVVMISDAADPSKAVPGMLYVYVDDVDGVYARAIAAGATAIMEPADQFYGDRHGGVRDLAGNQWWIATHKEDISPDELQRRAREFSARRGES